MEAAGIAAEQHSYTNARGLVVTSIANLYLQAGATARHLAAARARAGSAEVVLAADRSDGRDSPAARARLLSERQRVIALQNIDFLRGTAR